MQRPDGLLQDERDQHLKPPLDPSDAGHRAGLSAMLQSSGATMSEDWAVVLMNAPLFSQKADVLYDIIPGGDPTGGGGSNLVCWTEVP